MRICALQRKNQLFLAEPGLSLTSLWWNFSLAFLHLPFIDQAVLHFSALAINHKKERGCYAQVCRPAEGTGAGGSRSRQSPAASASRARVARWQCGTPAAAVPEKWLAFPVFISAKLMIAPTTSAREQNKIIS